MTISPEAKDAGRDWAIPAIEFQKVADKLTAPLQEEILILKKIEAYANEKLANANHHSVFESIDDAALTLTEQRKEIEELQRNTIGTCSICHHRAWKLRPDGVEECEVCRLRGEVEKAWFSSSQDSVEETERRWIISRAKRVAEGKE